MPGWIGRTLGKVQIELLLARGGIADVYLGRHTTLQRAVAVKVLNSHHADDPDLLERFQREARVVAMLRHPNIVQVHDFDAVDGRPFLVMEYVPGVPLSTHMRAYHASGRHLEFERIDRLLNQVADALQFAHERGVIHRDVKPANILITSPTKPVEPAKQLPADFQAVLTDFGLVRFVAPAKQTSHGQIAGTPAYMSPEQTQGFSLDARTDIYSLGVVLYELLAGRVPFEADSAVSVLQMHVNDPPPGIPGLPESLRQVLERALEKDPSKRYGSARELALAFHSARAPAAREAGLRADDVTLTDAGLPPKPRPLFRSGLSTALAGAVILALAGVLGVSSLISPRPSHAAPTPTPLPASATTAAGPTIGDPIGVLRFQDGAASVDEVSFKASSMPLPPAGQQYEVWLTAESGEERRSIGYLQLDANGNGTLTFVDAEGRNLLASYTGLEVTLEPNPDSSPNPSGDAAFAFALPPDGLLHVQHLLVAFGRAPNQSALLTGLLRDSELVNGSSKAMLAAYESGDESKTRSAAEATLNLLVGSKSPDYRDWNGDGRLEDPGDGYGLLLNGDNSGYIQGSYDHAQLAATAADATDNMQSHGEHVMVCTRNMDAWSTQLRDLTVQILASPFDASMGALIRQVVALSDNLLAGTDLNGNERVEAITGEGGAQTAYQHALYMADMVVLRTK